MNFIKKLGYIFSNGRPMIHEGFSFTDRVSGRHVNRYTDVFGRKWLANGKWSNFRVKRS